MKNLICGCCGSTAIGRQWWNQDTGYGLCGKCARWLASPFRAKKGSNTGGDETTCYGKPGRHFATPLTTSASKGDLVSWYDPDEVLRTGIFKEIDHDAGVAIVKDCADGTLAHIPTDELTAAR